jgi:hypothetical protein
MVTEHDANMDVPLDEMEARLAALRNLVRVFHNTQCLSHQPTKTSHITSQNATQSISISTSKPSSNTPAAAQPAGDTQSAPGWKMAESSSWRPAPIGVWHSGKQRLGVRA